MREAEPVPGVDGDDREARANGLGEAGEGAGAAPVVGDLDHVGGQLPAGQQRRLPLLLHVPREEEGGGTEADAQDQRGVVVVERAGPGARG